MIHSFFIAIVSLLLICTSPAYSEEESGARVNESDSKSSFITLTLENDLFANGGDKHYTSGVRLTYYDVKKKTSPLAQFIARHVPFVAMNSTTSIYYAIGQNLYTPRDITKSTLTANDRPWAGFIYGMIGLSNVGDHHIDELDVTLGMVGPAALGKRIQTKVHRIVNAPHPRGWHLQLRNEPALMISGQRRWPEMVSLRMNGHYFDVVPHAGLTLGNVYSYANMGVTFQVTPYPGRWNDQPLRVRPAVPGTGYFMVPEDHVYYSLFTAIDIRAIARNIFLDGNSFTSSHYVRKRIVVADLSAGLSVTYAKVRLSYTINYRTREFYGQRAGDIFGAIGVSYRF